ncbi:uncharacterized protein LOC131207229 [Anopheles bellator]|uniref:uncharacterized protein LOC131207229 n=1 Tax=Anopheles bellator TaxID=139047 RepID=UPI002647A09C|nr:uncharacterized protein LOC131207229 [Anopheles bellator]
MRGVVCRRWLLRIVFGVVAVSAGMQLTQVAGETIGGAGPLPQQAHGQPPSVPASSQQVTVAKRAGKADRKATPITYIKPLPVVVDGPNELLHHQPKQLLGPSTDDTRVGAGKTKPKNGGNRFAPKSLNLIPPKDLSNAELFSKLGLGRVRPSTNHHRKRLAEESRHHGRPDDSHMYVIKLPPNPYYYAHNVAPQNSIADVGKQVPVGFKSNGKPARIYHWNIPALKKILGAKQSRHPNSRRHEDIDELIDIKEIPTWTKPWEGAPREKSLLKAKEGTAGSQKKKFPTYYAPVKKQTGGSKSKKHANGKYNTGSNGKPQSFYILGQDSESRTKIVSHTQTV